MASSKKWRKKGQEKHKIQKKEGRPLMPNKIKIQKSKWLNEKFIPPPLSPKIHHICLIPIFSSFFFFFFYTRNWHYRYIGNTICALNLLMVRTCLLWYVYDVTLLVILQPGLWETAKMTKFTVVGSTAHLSCLNSHIVIPIFFLKWLPFSDS